MLRPTTLVIKNFAQIGEIHLEFGDLTVLVGAQATGKSLALQWLKFALDGREVISTLEDAGNPVAPDDVLLDVLFGSGMSKGWNDESVVELNGRPVILPNLKRRGRKDGRGKVFFIPAHRAMLMADGWAAPFQRLTADTPVVARLFSQHLFERFSDRRKTALFPVTGKLKKPYRRALDEAIFHGGQVAVEDDQARHARRIVMNHGELQIPFMAWTAGQREFTPLLLGLYALLPSTRRRRVETVEWVIIEEPELGLHPNAIGAFMLLVLDLLWRGYRVALSSHSPDILTAVWMLQQLKRYHARWQLVLDGFGITPGNDTREVAEAALAATYKVFHLAFADDGRVYSADISALDVTSENEAMAEWGELTAFTSAFGTTVARAVNEMEAA